ncbi:hypothetical protein L9F63_010105, partial [Diploptera punctata]
STIIPRHVGFLKYRGGVDDFLLGFSPLAGGISGMNVLLLLIKTYHLLDEQFSPVHSLARQMMFL